MKSIYGIPYNVSTKSGNPLADDFSLMIVNTMKFKNVSAEQQKIPFSWSFDTVKEKNLGKENGAYVYYIKMLEWKTETHFRPALRYDLQLFVFDDKANEIENNTVKGFFYFDKSKPGKENLFTATSDILEKLFSEKLISKQPGNKIEDEAKDIKVKATDHQQSEATQENFSFSALPAKVKDKVRKKCAQDYPDDFAMQSNCAQKQAAGWFELNK